MEINFQNWTGMEDEMTTTPWPEVRLTVGSILINYCQTRCMLIMYGRYIRELLKVVKKADETVEIKSE